MLDVILLENGDSLLQENGNFILLEIQSITILSKIYKLGETIFDGTLIRNDSIIKLKKGGIIQLK